MSELIILLNIKKWQPEYEFETKKMLWKYPVLQSDAVVPRPNSQAVRSRRTIRGNETQIAPYLVNAMVNTTYGISSIFLWTKPHRNYLK